MERLVTMRIRAVGGMTVWYVQTDAVTGRPVATADQVVSEFAVRLADTSKAPDRITLTITEEEVGS